MKTLTKSLLNDWSKSESVIERLTAALVAHGLDASYFSDLANYGASGGFPAITYYSDTCAFYEANKSDIWELLNEQADEMGYSNPVELINTFGGCKDVGSDVQFENLLTWFAAEECARYVTDNFKLSKALAA